MSAAAGSIRSGSNTAYAYSRRTMPIVPPQYGKREMHPVVLLNRTPIEAMVGDVSERADEAGQGR